MPNRTEAGESRTPFQRVVDDLTGGCGCGCHTGIGYRSSCEHCFGSGVTTTAGASSPSTGLPDPDPSVTIQRLRGALSLARSMILAGERMSDQAARTFDEAFAAGEPWVAGSLSAGPWQNRTENGTEKRPGPQPGNPTSDDPQPHPKYTGLPDRPRTEAGRRVLPWLAAHYWNKGGRLPSEADAEAAADILAIEAEASTGADAPPAPALVCPDCGHRGAAHTTGGSCHGSFIPGGACLCIRMWPIESEPPSEHLAEKIESLERTAGADAPPPLDEELAAIYLAAAMKECGYTASEQDAAAILDYLEGDNGVALARLRAEQEGEDRG